MEENCIMRSFIICTSQNIIKVIISRRMRWVGHFAHMVEATNSYKILVQKPEDVG
jgi:hypothetical protein